MVERKTDRTDTWLGIDLGTQSVRVVAVSSAGSVLGQGTTPLKSTRKGVRHEQQPQEWWSAVCQACQSALATVDAGSVRGLAVDGTSGTILLADWTGQPITPGLMYDDARAADEVQHINEAGKDIWEILGYHRMQASWALPKILWLLKHNENIPPGTCVMHQADFINRHLTGHMLPSDSSSALKTGFDVLEERWPQAVIGKLALPFELFPSVVRSGTQIGTVGVEAARQTGIPLGTPVIAGMTDGCAAQIGAGALSIGSWNTVLGTTLVFKGVTQELVHDPNGVVYSHRAPDGNWLPGGASSTGAGILSKYFPGRDLDALAARAAQYEPTTCVMYPLAGQGERFPFTASGAEGFILGTPTDDGELYASMLQGIAFIERLCFDYLDMLHVPIEGDIRITGGGTRSRYWNQLRSNILGRPMSVPENAEPALGMAILAASTRQSVAESAKEMVHVREVLHPHPGATERFLVPYMKLVQELERRGWLPAEVAAHARRRANI